MNGTSQEWVVSGTKADAEKFEARKRLGLGTQGPERRTAPRFSRVCELYSQHAELHLKESTWRKVRIYQVATLSEHLGALRLDEMSVEDVDRLKKLRLGDGVEPSTVNNELRVLRTILTWAKDSGYMAPDIKWKKLKPRGEDRVKVWSDAEIERIFEAAREVHQPLLPMLVFMLNTGLRKGEATAARWSWVNLEDRVLTVPANRFWQPKNGRSRDVPLSDAAVAVLSGPRRHTEVLFPNRKGQHYVDFPKDLFWEVLEKARVEGHPHMFRHTFASKFLHAVPDMQLLAGILGHSTTRVTEIYAHLLPGRLDRAKNAVNLAPRTVAMTVAKGIRGTKKPA